MRVRGLAALRVVWALGIGNVTVTALRRICGEPMLGAVLSGPVGLGEFSLAGVVRSCRCDRPGLRPLLANDE